MTENVGKCRRVSESWKMSENVGKCWKSQMLQNVSQYIIDVKQGSQDPEKLGNVREVTQKIIADLGHLR